MVAPTFPFKDNFFVKSLLQNSNQVGLFIIDTRGIIVGINKGVKNWLGYNDEDLVGTDFSVLFIEEDRQAKKPERELAKVLADGHCEDNNYILHKNGNYVWVNGESILIENGEERFVLKNIHDLRNEKRLQKDLSKANKELSNFVYAASHDLKAPISNISGLVAILEESSLDGEVQLVLNMMRESVKYFDTILDELAELGKSQNGTQEEPEHTISLSIMLDEVIFQLNDLIKESKANIIRDFTEVPYIVFSRKNLRSLFYNIISNAIKYRHPDRTPVVQINTESIDGFTLLKIQDNGLGISQENIGMVFNLYNRFKKEGIIGTGVGMAIVKNIMDNSDGKIEIESEEGKWSLFKLYFPK